MRKTDILVITVCGFIIIGAVYMIYKGSVSKPQTPVQSTKEITNFTGNIDKDTIKKLRDRKDYGTPGMDGIGREDPFAQL